MGFGGGVGLGAGFGPDLLKVPCLEFVGGFLGNTSICMVNPPMALYN